MTPCRCDPNKMLNQSTPIKGNRLTAGAALGALLLPHLPCAVGAMSAFLGIGGGAALWCGHQSAEATSSYGLRLPRLPSLPDHESRHSYPPEISQAATQALLGAQPAFSNVIAAKTADANGAPVSTVFFKDASQNINVVVCLNGAMCPCSKPQAYQIGKLTDLHSEELFPGQHTVLRIFANQR